MPFGSGNVPTPNNIRSNTRAGMNTYKSIKVLKENGAQVISSPKFGNINNTMHVSCPDGFSSPRENDN